MLRCYYYFFNFAAGLFLEEKGHGPCGSHGEQSAIVPGQVNSNSGSGS